ncbi:MAG TPA: hypothetical protein VNE40_00560 [Candidatus Dormibacteraeota bacterium]|nr:hypothetical protein [Candidatus Dormibacteraeota bacterium]
MAIEGLITVPQPSEVNLNDDHVGASVEALDILGLVKDRDQVTESVAAEYSALNQSGRTGEAFVQLPRSVITLEGMVNGLDNAKYPGDRQYPETFVVCELWTPGFDKGGYNAQELDNLTLGGDGNFAPHARLAIHNTASAKEPLLHFLYKPIDSTRTKGKEQTQLGAIEKAVKAYEAESHEGFEMTPLNAKAVAFIALVRRIKGEAMPMAWGYMRDATLSSKTVDGVSLVGYVHSFGDRFGLDESDGYARSNVGVGLSVGPKELKS